jgi:hypothetical protein
MQALNSFISPILGFDGDIPILAILVLGRSPGDELMSDPSVGARASSSKARVGK